MRESRQQCRDSFAFYSFVVRHQPLLSLHSVRPNNEAIAFAVLEHGVGAPGLFLRRTFEFHAAFLQFGIRLIDAIARVRHVHERADPLFVAFGGEQHDSRLRLWNSQFDPSLFLVERLIGDDREPEFIGVKIERAILIGNGNTDEFDLLDHDPLNLMWPISSRPDANSSSRKKPLYVYRYSGVIDIPDA